MLRDLLVLYRLLNFLNFALVHLFVQVPVVRIHWIDPAVVRRSLIALILNVISLVHIKRQRLFMAFLIFGILFKRLKGIRLFLISLLLLHIHHLLIEWNLH